MTNGVKQPGARSKPPSRRIRNGVRIALALVVALPLGYYGWQRGWRTNFGVVVAGRVYRSAQPDADQIRRWAGKYGIRTIINLRGRQSEPFDAANRAAAGECGVKIVDIKSSARRLPPRDRLRKMVEAIESAEPAVLIHCRDGADRSGVASVIAAMAIGGKDYQAAKRELSLRYFHLGYGTDRMHNVMTQYEQYCRDRSLDTGGWKQFRTWALNEYAGREVGAAP